jgi:hypothetical protein
MTRRVIVVAAALALTLAGFAPARAAKLAKGNCEIWVGLNGNRSHILTPPASISSLGEENEVGVHVAGSYFLTDAWAGVLSFGYDVGRQKFEPAAGTESKFESSSYNVRLGLDRYAFINDAVAIYAGPGILYWKGKASDTNILTPGVKTDWPDVTEWAFNGRLGMYARLGSHYGLFGHIGQVIGSNSGEDANGKVSWWTSHNEGSVGLALDF